MVQARKSDMPDFVTQLGDGSLVGVQKLEVPQPKIPPAASIEPPLSTGGKPAGGPAGGKVVTPTGGGPSVSHDLAASLPLQPSQRGKDEKTQETGSAAVAKSLAPQLLSSPNFLNRQQIDERKLAVLNFYTQTAYNYLGFRGYVDKVRFWAWFVDAELVTSQAIDGLARRHAIRAIEASSGASVQEIAKKPDIVSRNLWNRAWKEKAERSGQVVPEES